jgi:hypothetical protein
LSSCINGITLFHLFDMLIGQFFEILRKQNQSNI